MIYSEAILGQKILLLKRVCALLVSSLFSCQAFGAEATATSINVGMGSAVGTVRSLDLANEGMIVTLKPNRKSRLSAAFNFSSANLSSNIKIFSVLRQYNGNNTFNFLALNSSNVWVNVGSITGGTTSKQVSLNLPSNVIVSGKVSIRLTNSGRVSNIYLDKLILEDQKVVTPPQPPPPLQPPPQTGTTSVSYLTSSANISNPERGFYWQSDCDAYQFTATQLNGYKSAGTSMVRCVFYMRNFKTSALSQTYLDSFQRQMDTIRSAGFKVILRFAYTDSTAGDDASVTRVLSHIDQLAPYFIRNSDVIAYLEAGFVGAWGEWAYSRNFGTSGSLTTQNWTDRKKVTDKLLTVLPVNRSIQLRTPDFKMKLYGSAALTAAEAFSGIAKARVGHLNDCFLASDSDWGTYLNKSVEYPYLQEETKYTPMGGETCTVNAPRSSCDTAKSELAIFHWSNLHEGYHPDVINSWKTGGCYSEIKSKLGYRFVLQNGNYSNSGNVGGTISVGFSLINQGYASVYNDRNLELILRNEQTGSLFRIPLNADSRHWLPGSTISINQTVNLPASIPAGNYALLLALPDKASTLYSRPEYAIQLANSNLWEATTGFNKLNHSLVVNP